MELLQPKERAEELFKKMLYEIEYNCQPSITRMVAKKLSLIAIDEIIKELKQECDESQAVLYWIEVKAEVFWLPTLT